MERKIEIKEKKCKPVVQKGKRDRQSHTKDVDLGRNHTKQPAPGEVQIRYCMYGVQ